MNSAALVWLITGCSTGFGRDLARAVLSPTSPPWIELVTAAAKVETSKAKAIRPAKGNPPMGPIVPTSPKVPAATRKDRCHVSAFSSLLPYLR